MSEPVLTQAGKGRWGLSGDLDFTTVPIAWSLLKPLLDKEKKVTLSLGQVGRTNSAALALLLEALAYAENARCRLRLVDLPGALRDLAEVSSLGPILDKATA